VVASLIHIWAKELPIEVVVAKDSMDQAVSKRKEAHKQLLDTNYAFESGEISEEEFTAVVPGLVQAYKSERKIAIIAINERNAVLEEYTILHHNNLEQFLFIFGVALTITLLALLLLLVSAKIKQDYYLRQSIIFAGLCSLSIGLYWLFYTFVLNTMDYSPIYYYLLMALLSCLITLAVVSLLRSFEFTNTKVELLKNFIARERLRVAHKLKGNDLKDYLRESGDLNDTLKKVSKNK